MTGPIIYNSILITVPIHLITLKDKVISNVNKLTQRNKENPLEGFQSSER